MIRFYVQPSKILGRVWVGLYVLAVATSLQFEIALLYKYCLIGVLVVGAIHFMYRWRTSAVRCEYHANRNRWLVSKQAHGWVPVDKVCAVYVTPYLVWINFHTVAGHWLPVLAAADSMRRTQFIQLRRSVICPATLSPHSA